MSTNDEAVFFTVICSSAQQRQIVQFAAADPRNALTKWFLLMRSQNKCILAPEVLSELEQDFVEGTIEPVACDGVASVWNFSDVINDTLVDLVFVSTAKKGTGYWSEPFA